MLTELEIRNLGPIRHALLHPDTGMTAITGETGAGKSMLLNAIRLISGGSSDAGRVSAQAEQTWVQGVFDIGSDTAVAQMVRDAGIDVEADDGELFATRIVPASGRSRALISGHAVPRSLLAGISRELVTIHGQSDQLRIASSARQRQFLDGFAHDDALLTAYADVWGQLVDLDSRLHTLLGQERSDRQRAEYLKESLARIDQVDPQSGEDEELKAQRDRIEHAAQIIEGVNTALAALDNSQVDADAPAADATVLITRAAQALRSIHVGDTYEELASRLDSINADLADVVFSLSGDVDQDEGVGDLDTINARIHELGELTRGWGPQIADVLAWKQQAQLELEDLDASPEKVSGLQEERQGLFEQTVGAARDLYAARSKAAKLLEQTVNAELSSLAMSGSALHVSVSERGAESQANDDRPSHDAMWPLDSHGIDEVSFMFTPFPGAPELPLGKSASGGELSRLMLALELAAADGGGKVTQRHVGADDPQMDTHGPMTFIFDEVDAGVGGRSAVELAKRLARLAEHAQVIVVTHLAQVASWAGTQYMVKKGVVEGQSTGSRSAERTVATSVVHVEGEERVHEIARMLSGSESETSLDHARELLDSSSL